MESEISEVYGRYSVATEQAARIQEVLAETQGEVTLKTIIESEGGRAADQLLLAQLETAKTMRAPAEDRATSLQNELKAIDVNASSIRQDRLRDYAESLRKNFAALGAC